MSFPSTFPSRHTIQPSQIPNQPHYTSVHAHTHSWLRCGYAETNSEASSACSCRAQNLFPSLPSYALGTESGGGRAKIAYQIIRKAKEKIKRGLGGNAANFGAPTAPFHSFLLILLLPLCRHKMLRRRGNGRTPTAGRTETHMDVCSEVG